MAKPPAPDATGCSTVNITAPADSNPSAASCTSGETVNRPGFESPRPATPPSPRVQRRKQTNRVNSPRTRERPSLDPFVVSFGAGPTVSSLSGCRCASQRTQDVTEIAPDSRLSCRGCTKRCANWAYCTRVERRPPRNGARQLNRRSECTNVGVHELNPIVWRALPFIRLCPWTASLPKPVTSVC